MDSENISEFGISHARKYTPGKMKTDYDALLISLGAKSKNQKNYLQVKDRLRMLRELFPEATIDTECLEATETYARFRAIVALPNGARGTGHGSETKSDFGD